MGESGGLGGDKARCGTVWFPKESQEQGFWGIWSPVRALSGLRGPSMALGVREKLGIWLGLGEASYRDRGRRERPSESENS